MSDLKFEDVQVNNSSCQGWVYSADHSQLLPGFQLIMMMISSLELRWNPIFFDESVKISWVVSSQIGVVYIDCSIAKYLPEVQKAQAACRL